MASTLQLLGIPRLHTGAEAMILPDRQPLLLGAYLAYREEWVSRDELLALFWEEEREGVARHNLSQLLYHCRKQPWMKGLEVERNRVRWAVPTDVRLLREALGQGDWQGAAEHFGGTLLEGISTAQSPAYQGWLEQEREELYHAWREAILRHGETLEASGRPAEAAQLLRQILNRDALAEEVLQAYMRCAAAAGQRDQALGSYQAFAKQLERELDMRPLETTARLAVAIRRAEAQGETVPPPRPSPSQERQAPSTTPPARRNFPSFPTPFIGRDLERAELTKHLQDSGVRLVTILGPGGIGKTRLAVRVAEEQASSFRHGAAFVPLASLGTAGFIAASVAEALSLSITAGTSVLEQLCIHLSDKEMLLVLDNIEHLLEGSDIIPELLEASPASRILLTSREALGIHGEYLYDLAGLDYPPDDLTIPGESFDAITLFLHSARRINSHFSLAGNSGPGVARISRLLQGMPLGIELAAAWTRVLSPTEIADEIAGNLEVLDGLQLNLPERHRSLRAVFEHSWELLADAEREALKALAVFRGGFTRDAAGTVSGATLRTLLALVNKSLLQRTPQGRFIRHLMVQQFSEAKLEQDAAQGEAARRRHAAFFLALAEAAEPELAGPEQIPWLERLTAEHDNLRAALSWALTADLATALRMCGALYRFWYLRGHYQEGRRYLDSCLEHEVQESSPWAKVLNAAATLAQLQEDYQAARPLYQRGLAIQRASGDAPGMASTLNNFGNLELVVGNYPAAREHWQTCLAIFEKTGDERGYANTLNNLAAVAQLQEDLNEAQRLNEKSLTLARKAGNTFVIGRCLGNLGYLALQRGRLAEAHELRQASLAIFRELGYRVGIAVNLQGLGDIELQQEDGAAAEKHYASAMKLFHQLGDARGVSELLLSFAALALHQGRHQDVLFLTGAATSLHHSLGAPIPPASQKALEQDIRAASEALGWDIAEQLLARGRAATMDEAMRAALEPAAPTSAAESARDMTRATSDRAFGDS